MGSKAKKMRQQNAERAPAQFRMIDVGQKRTTRRRAIASGKIIVGAEAYRKLVEKTLPKGDALALAEIAGIMGAKRTPDLLPMCHTLAIDQVSIHCIPEVPDAIAVYAQVTAHAKTGVEMEAVMAVQAALATIWDLTKAAEPALVISDVRLLVKEGGKSGLWINPAGIPSWLEDQLPEPQPLMGLSGALLVMSDRAFEGSYEDRSGPIAREFLERQGAKMAKTLVIPDDRSMIEKSLREMASMSVDFIITSGGTGLSPRDMTPEAVESVCDRMAPGLGELLRKDGSEITDKSWLSRSVTGCIGKTLVVALPGSPKAVLEGLEALLTLLPHTISMIRGGKHD